MVFSDLQWDLCLAAQNGYLEVVKYLCSLENVDPSAKDNYAVRWAAYNGHLEVVKFLCSLEKVDPSAALSKEVKDVVIIKYISNLLSD